MIKWVHIEDFFSKDICKPLKLSRCFCVCVHVCVREKDLLVLLTRILFSVMILNKDDVVNEMFNKRGRIVC